MKDVVFGQIYPVDSPVHRADARAKFLEDLRHTGDVGDMGCVADDDPLLCENGCGKQGQHGIFCRLQPDAAAKPAAPVDNVFIHVLSYLLS